MNFFILQEVVLQRKRNNLKLIIGCHPITLSGGTSFRRSLDNVIA